MRDTHPSKGAWTERGWVAAGSAGRKPRGGYFADWSAHEREAIASGVRATITGLVAGRDITVLEIDFSNPATAAHHCPPRSTFVHRLAGDGLSRRVDIHYV